MVVASSIEFLQQRVDGANKRIVSLKKRLERIQRAKELDWKVNPYYYDESDLRSTQRDLEEAEASLEKYKNQLTKEIQKSASRNVKVIIEFLDNWKKELFEIYDEAFKELFRISSEAAKYGAMFYDYTLPIEEREKAMETCQELHRQYYELRNGRFESREVKDFRTGKMHKVRTKVLPGKYEFVNDVIQSNYEESVIYLRKQLDKEANAKYDAIIERTNKIVGQIIDASNLYIAPTGELNGYIIGTDGKAKVQTIGAGGYNQDIIVNVKHGQIFHFRTLISELV